MTKKIKPQANTIRTKGQNYHGEGAGELGKTVGTLLQSHRSRTETIQKLRSNRSELRQEYEAEISNIEKSYLQKIEEVIRETETIKARIAEEKHRNAQLKHASKHGGNRLEQLTEEIKNIQKLKNKTITSMDKKSLKKEQLNEEIKSLRQERVKATEELTNLKLIINETKKNRRSLENKQERVKCIYETQKEKLSDLESRYTTLKDEHTSRIEMNSDKLKKVKQDLSKRFSARRLAQEKRQLESKYSEKLSKILEQIKNFNKEQLKEYEEKTRQIKVSTQKMAARKQENETHRKSLENVSINILNEISELEKEIEKFSIILKDAAFAHSQNKEESINVSYRILDNIEIYFNLVKRYEFQISEKITILRHLNEAKEVLENENCGNANSVLSALSEGGFNEESLLDGVETEGEQDSINMEDRMLHQTLFPELMGDLEKRNLKLEAYLFGRKISVTNIGADPIFLEKGNTAIKLKKNKLEFILTEDVTLNPGQCFVVVRGNRGDDIPENCVVVYGWKAEMSERFAVDEIDLVRNKKVVTKNIVIFDGYYDRIMEIRENGEDDRVMMGERTYGEGRKSGKGGKSKAVDKTCSII